jgi:hypothetical protein
VYNGGCSLCANVSSREVPDPYVHANVAVREVLEPCVRDNVAVGEVPEPCGSTAGGAAGILLMSPCFRRGLRTTVVMDARGEPSWDEPDGTPVLFPRHHLQKTPSSREVSKTL